MPGDTEGRPSMSRQLTSDSSLETLRKEAKRWLKAIRGGDVRARERLNAAMGSPAIRAAAAGTASPTTPGLRDIQLALAREYGLPGWSALKQALDDLALAQRSRSEHIEIALRSTSWGGDRTA